MHYSVLLFFSNLFSSDMLIIIFIALLLFGGEKLPEIARGLGKGIRDFKDASEGVKREINNQINSFEEKREEKKLDEAAVAHQQELEQPSSSTTETTAGVIRPALNSVPVNDIHVNNEASHGVAEENKELQTEHVAENVHGTPDANTGTSTK
ncbi:Sec-independent protein translocase subunit TatA/TatB [Mucilaginibacter sp. X4EP1]|jgi:sec-independent protein translocase protein TatA|uniref:Sec-independent protein translocase subunit TatA/TatB n=1 Tax=Mucilaginibacter sp. X4EP1 TaxID=2723092 RepID=UPI0021687EF2|nr:twin-arginine translocase TatA/TatE family subunit [Mucilaginibacter sp. X4EP1]MCS3813917.1 TatA/E family protein of Tat protein translocase [Mucilaginibacter sp. X4EP1]